MKLKEWLKKDGWVYIVCLVAVLICLLTYNNSLGVTQKCNEYWQYQWEEATKNSIVKIELPSFYNFSIENNKGDEKK